MLEVKSLNLEPCIKETVWIGDPAVDLDNTNVDLWIETGEGYSIKPGMQPSLIRYRALNSLELKNTLQASSVFFMNQANECVRYGLVSIEGMKLHRTIIGGIGCLDNHSLLVLKHPLNVNKVTNLLFESFGIDKVEASDRVGDTSLLEWLGGLIARDTFLSLKRA
jgi:hypothetical protein